MPRQLALCLRVRRAADVGHHHHTGLPGQGELETLLSAHESARNERVRPMYEFTNQLAALEPPPPQMQQLFGALRDNQDATNAFFSAITGAISLQEFLSEENLAHIMSAAHPR